MSPAPPSDATVAQLSLQQIATVAGAIGTFFIGAWGVLRVLLRPFVDDSRYESWKRKAPDAEKFMRETMFVADFTERRAIKALAEQGVQLAAMNASAIATLTTEITRVFEAQRASATLLNGIPHLAGSVEQLSDHLGALRTDLRTSSEQMWTALNRTNDIAQENGQRIAAHSAILRERGVAIPDEMDPDQRQFTRRRSDRPLAPRLPIVGASIEDDADEGNGDHRDRGTTKD